MGRTLQATRVESVDFASVFRFARLFESYRIAIHPARLLLGLLLIVTLYLGGKVMDTMWGPRVVPNEFSHFVQRPLTGDGGFTDWRQTILDGTKPEDRRGVFYTALGLTLNYFDRAVDAALNLRLGASQLRPQAPPSTDSIIGSLRMMAMIPAWVWHTHRGFFLIYLVLFIALWSLIGGAVSRQTIAEATRRQPVTGLEALSFAWRRWGGYVAAPLMPLAVAGALVALLATGGALFNVSLLGPVGGLGFFLALGVGFVITLVLVAWIGAVHLMYPALSCEGADGFDAMSRSYSYILARPWRFVFYTLVSLVYGALTYMFVGLFIFLLIAITQWGVGAWVGAEAAEGLNRFDAILPPPEFGSLHEIPSLDPRLPWPDKIAATLTRIWIYLAIGLLGAYVITYYFASCSVIYLLLRQHTDGADPAELFLDQAPAPTPRDKIEPPPPPATNPGTTDTPPPSTPGAENG
ncbi:MAG: hypothetical protein ACYTGQ_06325 [Planctomycetota bacterium]|jgi:hypothetical protein